MKRHFNSKFDLKTEKEICELYSRGVEFGSVFLGKKFKCKPATILKVLRDNGIRPRNFSTSQIGLRLGDKHPNFKGGCVSGGYKRIYVNGKCVHEHRYLIEKNLGRKLNSFEVVHHLDGNGLNNLLENLIIVSRSNHPKIHFTGKTNEKR